MTRSGHWLVLALLALVFSGGSASAQGGAAVSFQDIEESLTCQCGCGLTVHSCNHVQCPSAIPLREEIRAQMAEGKDRAAILAYFAGKYGEKILSSPTTSGFNLLAWVMPFLLLALAATVLAITLTRWSGRNRRVAVPAAPAARVPTAHDKILERELERFDG